MESVLPLPVVGKRLRILPEAAKIPGLKEASTQLTASSVAEPTVGAESPRIRDLVSLAVLPVRPGKFVRCSRRCAVAPPPFSAEHQGSPNLPLNDPVENSQRNSEREKSPPRKDDSLSDGDPGNPDDGTSSTNLRDGDGIVNLQDIEVTLDVQLKNETLPLSTVVRERNDFWVRLPSFVWTLAGPFGILPPARRIEERKIITRISGSFLAGRLVALLGPSGAGKTTLLNVLAGRIAHTSGQMHFNGCLVNSPDSVRRESAYIQQLDLFNTKLTVQEHLKIQIKLRAPHLSPQSQAKLCARLLSRFNLQACARTVIGDMGAGISGGERKRVSVATAVVNNPKLMLADEPTTGLDANMAASVVAALRTLADSGRAVVASLHQPSSHVFTLFDEVLLLSEGRLLYFGDRLGSVEWFRRLGYDCPKLANPADFLLRCVSLPAAESRAEHRTAKAAELHRFATAWASEGEAFLDWWAHSGRFFFYKSSRCFVQRNISALLATEGETAQQLLSSQVAAAITALEFKAKPQEKQQLVTVSTDTSAEHPVIFYPPLNWGEAVLSPHSAPVESVRQKLDIELERIFAHPSSRRMKTTSCGVSEPPLSGSMMSRPATQPARDVEDSSNLPSNTFSDCVLQQSPPTFGRPFVDGAEEEPEHKAVSVASNCSDVWRNLISATVKPRKATWSEQFHILLWREFRAMTRDHIQLHAQIAQMLLVGAVLTSIFWQLNNTDADSRAKLSAIFFLICNQGLVAAISVCSTFTQEKVVAQREIEAGVIRVSSYVLAKVTSDMPSQTLLPAAFTSICYWGMHLGDDWQTYLGMLLVTILVSWSAISIGYLGSACALNSDQALMFAQIWAIPALLFAGFVINLTEIPKPLQCLQYVSYFRYGYLAYTYLAFHDRQIIYNLGDAEVKVPGDEYVKSFLGYAVTSASEFWTQVGLLCVMLVVFRTLVILVAIPASKMWKENRTL